MKTVFLIRHAKSSWDQGGLADIDRPLNARGKATAPIMADIIFNKGIRPDLIITSPAKRARSTAKYFRKKYGIKKTEVQIEPALYHGDENSVIEVIRNLPDSINIVMLFGHNPSMNYLSALFSDKGMHVPTCGIQHLEFHIDKWTELSPDKTALKEFIYPKQFIPEETND
ncbi:MAG: histidine phosphatase family protein [Saprospiraceae bacterium]